MLRKDFEGLVKLLTTLSSKNYSTTTLTRLAKDSGFRNAADPRFKNCLRKLEKDQVIEVQQSGFKGDSMHHPKIVVLKADLLIVHEAEDGLIAVRDDPEPIISWKDEKEDKEVAPKLGLSERFLVTRFCHLLYLKRMTGARRLLTRIENGISQTKWHRGYIQSLHGMLAVNPKDKYAFLPTINFRNKEEIQHLRREFRKHAKNKRHGPYDRGFFTAWMHFTRLILQLHHRKIINNVTRNMNPVTRRVMVVLKH